MSNKKNRDKQIIVYFILFYCILLRSLSPNQKAPSIVETSNGNVRVSSHHVVVCAYRSSCRGFCMTMMSIIVVDDNNKKHDAARMQHHGR
jgi:hypothetical protein